MSRSASFNVKTELLHISPSLFLCVCLGVCVRRAWCMNKRAIIVTGLLWCGLREILCGGSITYYPGSNGCAWVASEVISVKFAYHGAPIQTSRHRNASPSATHNEGVPVELVISVLVANSAPGFLTSQLLTVPNVLGFLTFLHFASTKLNALV